MEFAGNRAQGEIVTHIAAVIQARTGSTRLPGKALRLLVGVTLTEHIIKRVQAVKEIDRIVLAIPLGSQEKPLQEIAKRSGIDCVQGPEEDVLKRFILAGDQVEAEHIVRICGDNPLVDLNLMRSLILQHAKESADYTFCSDPIPLGSGSEVVKLSTLKEISLKTTEPVYLEHVTTYFQDHPDGFHLEKIPAPSYLKDRNVRLTVDTEQDFFLLDQIYQKFYSPSQSPLDLESILQFLADNPRLSDHNSDVKQKNWRLG
jgi:spore coat polysaccharide biosynthesis protein SpsF